MNNFVLCIFDWMDDDTSFKSRMEHFVTKTVEHKTINFAFNFTDENRLSSYSMHFLCFSLHVAWTQSWNDPIVMPFFLHHYWIIERERERMRGKRKPIERWNKVKKSNFAKIEHFKTQIWSRNGFSIKIDVKVNETAQSENTFWSTKWNHCREITCCVLVASIRHFLFNFLSSTFTLIQYSDIETFRSPISTHTNKLKKFTDALTQSICSEITNIDKSVIFSIVYCMLFYVIFYRCDR